MDWLSHVIAIGLAFGMTVFVHELGHFVAARLSGMAVHEFSIGFGRPLLFWFHRGETQYSFRLWPFVSYVRIAGMEPGEDHPRGFNKKSRLAQAFVLVLGCLMNFLLGIAIFVFVGVVLGRPVEGTNRIGRVLPGEPAALAGLQVGDAIVGFDGRRDLELEAVVEHIQGHAGEPVSLEIEREGQPMTVVVTPTERSVRELESAADDSARSSSEEAGSAAATGQRSDEEEAEPLRLEDARVVYRKVGRIGVSFEMKVRKLGVWESVVDGFRATFGIIGMLGKYLVLAAMGRAQLMLEGPVGVVRILYEQVQTGWMYFLNTSALFTVSIGFLNLLPIPPLDGSRLVITGVEAIRRRPVDKQKENLVHLIGFGLLLTLVAVLTYKDILRLVTGN